MVVFKWSDKVEGSIDNIDPPHKKESICIEDSAPEGEIISNQYPEGETSTRLVVKC